MPKPRPATAADIDRVAASLRAGEPPPTVNAAKFFGVWVRVNPRWNWLDSVRWTVADAAEAFRRAGKVPPPEAPFTLRVLVTGGF